MALHTTTQHARVQSHGKYFRLHDAKWYVKGFVYGPFAPNADGDYLPERNVVETDFMRIKDLGGNTVRVYHVPPQWFLEVATEHDLRVFVDTPWEKHRCFFEDWHVTRDARNHVRQTARMLGNDPAVFAISVANEIPIDVVRFYGRQRVERFVSELLDIVKQEAPQCLATYSNYPTTEFVEPHGCDFLCFNVYVHDLDRLADYICRLQHLAGDLPLVLGEFGADSLRNGEAEQARLVTEHARRAFRKGLAGTIVFAYTDDWFTGGNQVEDWAFGVTRRDRSDKPIASQLAEAWRVPPCLAHTELPNVSVVVCCYNGGSTLEECLQSLTQLNYPDYEVILVDDGSTDNTADIAKQFPHVQYAYQTNQGLSVARNLGAERARGDIIAYTDADCVADCDWLLHLAHTFEDGDVEAAGGPNITPASDGWAAKCVALCPGNPSHVMLDDHLAEHVPGCNMAFRRDVLQDIGGFDPQFRLAGDDVDIFWRMLDAGHEIGFSAGAMVWHHRRESVSAFLRQQRGYGHAEALLQLKHPRRSNSAGRSIWHGIIYGDRQYGALGMRDLVYHGPFGTAPFQLRYHGNSGRLWQWPLSLEWHVVALVLFLVGLPFPHWWLAGVALWVVTVVAAVRNVAGRQFPQGAPAWCRPLLVCLLILQPVVRRATRLWYFVRLRKLPAEALLPTHAPKPLNVRSWRQWDLNWESTSGSGRMELLDKLVAHAKQHAWYGDFSNEWTERDLYLPGDVWHDISLHTATEEIGGSRRFTRARCYVQATYFTRLAAIGFGVITALAWLTLKPLPLFVCVAIGIGFSRVLARSRQGCLEAITNVASQAAENVGLKPVAAGNGRPESPPQKTQPRLARKPSIT